MKQTKVHWPFAQCFSSKLFLPKTLTKQAANSASLVFRMWGILQRFSNGQAAGALYVPFFCFLPYINKLFGAANVFPFCFYKQVAKRGSAIMQVSHRTTMQPTEGLSLLRREASQPAILKLVVPAGWTQTACPTWPYATPDRQEGPTL